MLRRRNVNIKTIKEFDSFPKVREAYVQRSAVGGTFSLLSFGIMAYLIISETRYFLDSKMEFKFKPDTDIDAKLKINVDITVAMRCNRIGADILDSTNQNMIGEEALGAEDTWWDLTQEQRAHFDALKHMNSYLREEYHAIHELLWKSNQLALLSRMPERTHKPNYPPDACRVFGSLTINKVAGNFHITAGKFISLPKGHIHISAFTSEKDYNFTHRINSFSFGELSPGIVYPLEGDEKIADNDMMLYQYFIEVVPTDINLLLRTSKTYQYSVKDHQRLINHHKGSHGIPGIFFKYDMSALKIHVTQQRDTIFQFLVKLCAVLGGVFVTSGLVNSTVQFVSYIICCKFTKAQRQENEKGTVTTSLIAPQVMTTNSINVPPLHLSPSDTPECVLKPQ